MASRDGRLLRAGVAAALALVVLSGAGGSGATWAETVVREPGTVRSGAVTLTKGAATVELHSRQPAGSRTYASSTTCTPDPGYTQCRVVTSTIAGESLIPGDRVVVVERAALAVSGDNLTGTLEVTSGPLTSSTLSAFSGSATTVTTVTPPTGTGVVGGTVSLPVSARTGQGVGAYTIRSVITTPPANGGDDWGTALWGQRLYQGTYTYTFTQSRG